MLESSEGVGEGVLRARGSKVTLRVEEAGEGVVRAVEDVLRAGEETEEGVVGVGEGVPITGGVTLNAGEGVLSRGGG